MGYASGAGRAEDVSRQGSDEIPSAGLIVEVKAVTIRWLARRRQGDGILAIMGK